MSSFLCAICLDALDRKIAMSTTCGHVFCSECATHYFAQLRPMCPVCRRSQTFEQLIRLYPEYGAPSESSSDPTTRMPMPQPQPAPPLPPSPPLSVRSIPRAAGTEDVSSLRIRLDSPRFPWLRAGCVPACDKDGSPVFLGVAAFKDGMHPCKIRPDYDPMARVPYGGKEHAHRGTVYLLPFDPARMEWVPTFCGRLPPGRRVIEGGYERGGGEKLYHALALVDGVRVPGKAGDHGHAAGANVPYGGREHVVPFYEVLCWRD